MRRLECNHCLIWNEFELKMSTIILFVSRFFFLGKVDLCVAVDGTGNTRYADHMLFHWTAFWTKVWLVNDRKSGQLSYPLNGTHFEILLFQNTIDAFGNLFIQLKHSFELDFALSIDSNLNFVQYTFALYLIRLTRCLKMSYLKWYVCLAANLWKCMIRFVHCISLFSGCLTIWIHRRVIRRKTTIITYQSIQTKKIYIHMHDNWRFYPVFLLDWHLNIFQKMRKKRILFTKIKFVWINHFNGKTRVLSIWDDAMKFYFHILLFKPISKTLWIRNDDDCIEKLQIWPSSSIEIVRQPAGG